jgi:hypothetical protein
MMMRAIDEKIRDSKTNEPHYEIENSAKEGGMGSSVTVPGLVGIMG